MKALGRGEAIICLAVAAMTMSIVASRDSIVFVMIGVGAIAATVTAYLVFRLLEVRRSRAGRETS